MKLCKKHILIVSIMTLLTIIYVSQDFVFEKSGINGNSMYPTIKNGETVWCLTVLEENLTNQIVNYKHDNTIICHRVVQDKGSYIICKGDNNPTKDPWQIEKSQVTSKVLIILPWWGLFLDLSIFMSMIIIGMVIACRIDRYDA